MAGNTAPDFKFVDPPKGDRKGSRAPTHPRAKMSRLPLQTRTWLTHQGHKSTGNRSSPPRASSVSCPHWSPGESDEISSDLRTRQC